MKVQFAAIATMIAMSACGVQRQEKDSVASPKPQSANQAQKNDLFPADIAKTLPEASIVRIPVDKNGVEQQANAEFRLVKSAPAKVDAANVDAAFASSTAPEKKPADELDSSTESWFFHGGGYGRGGYGYGNGYGGGYGNGYGYGGYNSYYYNTYRPTYGYYGSYYTYYTPVYYNYGDYNYYYYPRACAYTCY